ncbi:PREDICTED: tectonic-3-like [Elephantulus edwardii]|uniref:tectonic-3-like n=1 Tax=Elephantulus edwardii TaxID=28737 RepID=UPI0003F0C46C|nr:PREDICTED: tectonic-3-like [Elephantulus edwardii]
MCAPRRYVLLQTFFLMILEGARPQSSSSPPGTVPTASSRPGTVPTASSPPETTVPTASSRPGTVPTASSPPETVPTASSHPGTVPTAFSRPEAVPSSSSPPGMVSISSSPPGTVPSSSSPPRMVPTSSDLGPSTLGGTFQSSSESTETPRALPGTSTVVRTAQTSLAPGNKTMDVFPVLPICVCDLTPGTCDINCCCDRDCYLPHPSTVFSFCLPGSVRSSSWVCVDNSLIFRSNSPFPTRVFMGSNGIKQFCVRVNNSRSNYFQNLQEVNTTNFQALATEFGGKSFTSTFQTQSPQPFYKAGDPIMTYFPKWSVVSLLRQPAEVGAGGLCAERNPASFLESKSTTCTRFFKNLTSSCSVDPALDAASYYNFTVLRVPRSVTDLQNMEVIYEIETNGTFGIQRVSASFELTNLPVEPDVSLQQHFIIRFKAFEQSTAASLPGTRSGNPGYIVGKPLLALTDGISHSMTLLQSQSDGSCSPKRHKIEFGMNAVSGCKLRLKKENCDHLHQEIYQTLHGRPRPEYVAIFGNADPSQKGQWTRILNKECKVLAMNCTSCCFIPVSLEIQILWAYVGLQSNPQAHVSGARFLYHCQSVQDSRLPTELSVTTLVTFVDITQKPEPPRGQTQLDWKMPFDFFFPFRVAFSKGADSPTGSIFPVLVFCLLLLGVLNLDTK